MPKFFLNTNKEMLFCLLGIKVVYNMNQNLNNRVVSIDIATMNESVPIYKPIDVNKYYTCISASFLANGGDGFDMISKYRRNHK